MTSLSIFFVYPNRYSPHAVSGSSSHSSSQVVSFFDHDLLVYKRKQYIFNRYLLLPLYGLLVEFSFFRICHPHILNTGKTYGSNKMRVRDGVGVCAVVHGGGQHFE